MTICSALVTNKTIYIGTDTLVTFDATYCRAAVGGKFLDLPTDDLIISFAGTFRATDILQNLLNEPELAHLLDVRCRQDVSKIANTLYSAVQEVGVGPPKENEMACHETSFLLVSAYCGSIFCIDHDYTVHEYEDYISIGSGSNFADAALYALGQTNTSAPKRIELALETACKFNPFCGGDLDIRSVKRKP